MNTSVMVRHARRLLRSEDSPLDTDDPVARAGFEYEVTCGLKTMPAEVVAEAARDGHSTTELADLYLRTYLAVVSNEPVVSRPRFDRLAGLSPLLARHLRCQLELFDPAGDDVYRHHRRRESAARTARQFQTTWPIFDHQVRRLAERLEADEALRVRMEAKYGPLVTDD